MNGGNLPDRPAEPAVSAAGKWIKLYDESRTPQHWLEIICPSEYCVFVMTANLHVPTDVHGDRFRQGEASAMIVSSLDGALQLAQEIVSAHPDLCCEIYSHTGKSGPPDAIVYEPSVRGKYQGIQCAKRRAATGFALLAVAAMFIVYDAIHDLAWLWGYIVGLKLAVIGTIFLIRGVSGFLEERVRAPIR